MSPGRDGRSSHVDASRYQRIRRRRLDEPVRGNRRRPERAAAVEWVRLRHADRDQSGRGGDLEDEAKSLVVDAGDLDQPLDVAHAEPAAAQFGDRRGRQRLEHHLDFAKEVDGRAGGDRVDVGRLGLRHHGVRRHESGGPWRFAAHHLPDEPRQDHGVGVDLPQQARGQQPLHRTVGRRAGCRVAGAADRRPVDESLQKFALGQIDALQQFTDPRRIQVGGLERHLPGMPWQSRGRLGRHPHHRVAPDQRPGRAGRRRRRSAVFSAPRSANDANSLANGTAAVSACNNSSASSTASRAKSRSSVAALTDCRDCARAANAAIDPGGGWVRSGRDSNNRMIRSSGSSANQVPSGTPGDTSVIVYQPKPAARVHPPVAPLQPTGTSPGRSAPAHRSRQREHCLPQCGRG